MSQDDIQRLLGDLIARVTNLERDDAGNRLTKSETEREADRKRIDWLVRLVMAAGAGLAFFFGRAQGWF